MCRDSKKVREATDWEGDGGSNGSGSTGGRCGREPQDQVWQLVRGQWRATAHRSPHSKGRTGQAPHRVGAEGLEEVSKASARL